MLVEGKMTPIVRHTDLFGGVLIAVLTTSESPRHAKSNIRKVLAHKRRLITIKRSAV